MKQMRIVLLISFSLTLAGLLIGTFFDLEISNAIASTSNKVGLWLSMIGPTIGYGGLAIIGGGFIALTIKGKYHFLLKIVFVLLSIVIAFVGIYFAPREFYGVNGLNEESYKAISYVIVIIVIILSEIGGYFIFRNCQNKNIWIVFMICLAVLGLALGVGMTVLKEVFRRPRYRTISSSDVPFYPWWKPCTDWETLLGINMLSREEFKSFPSGHTVYASLLLIPLCFIPLGNEKVKKYQIPIFLVGLFFVFLVGLGRILVGAHFLSDVFVGAGITIFALLIANEVVFRIKALH